MREKGTSKKIRVSGSSNNVDELEVILNPVPLQMVVLISFPQISQIVPPPRRRKHLKKLVPLKRNHLCMFIILLILFLRKRFQPHWKNHYHVESTDEQPHVESDAHPHVEPNIETFVPTSGEPQTEPHTKPTVEQTIDTTVFDTYMDNILNEDLRDEDPQNEEPKVQGGRNEKSDKDDDIHIINSMKMIIESVT